MSRFWLKRTRIHLVRMIFLWQLRIQQGSVFWELECPPSQPASTASRWSSTRWTLRRSQWPSTAAELSPGELSPMWLSLSKLKICYSAVNFSLCAVQLTFIQFHELPWSFSNFHAGTWVRACIQFNKIDSHYIKLDLQSPGSSPYLSYKDFVPVMIMIPIKE